VRGDDVVGEAGGGDAIQLALAEHLAGGVVGRVEHEELGARAERAVELVGIEVPAGRPQPHHPRDAARHLDGGHVEIIEGLEDDHLVARIDQGQDGVEQGLGGAAGDGDLGLRIDGVAVARLEVGGDGMAQAGQPGGGRVLVAVTGDGPRRGLLDEGGRGEVGEALAEVDRAVLDGQAGHLGEDRGPEAIEPARAARPR
jgi:hypothetical protein